MLEAGGGRRLRASLCLGLVGLLGLHAARAAEAGPDVQADVTVVAEGAGFRVLSELDGALDLPVLDWLAIADAAFSSRIAAEAEAEGAVREVVLAGLGFAPRATCPDRGGDEEADGHDYSAHVARGAAAFFARSCGRIHVQDPGAHFGAAELRATLLHEATHQLVAAEGYARLTGPGAWLSEGLGVFAETLSDSGKNDLRRVRRLAEARMLFYSGRLLPLAEFLALDARGLEGLGQATVEYPWRGRAHERHVALHHTQASSVMAWLQHDFPDDLSRLIRIGLVDGLPPERLEAELCRTRAELQRAYTNYFHQLRGA